MESETTLGATEAVDRLAAALAGLARGQEALARGIDELSDLLIEVHVRDRAPAFFQRIARKVRVLDPDELDDLLDPALADGRLTESECESVRLTDIVARARRRSDGADILLAVEVSWGIGPGDVERAVVTAGLLSTVGVETLPVVAGSWITPESAARAADADVAVVVGATPVNSAA